MRVLKRISSVISLEHTVTTHVHEIHGSASPLFDLVVAHLHSRSSPEPFWHLLVGIRKQSWKEYVAYGHSGQIVECCDIEM